MCFTALSLPFFLCDTLPYPLCFQTIQTKILKYAMRAAGIGIVELRPRQRAYNESYGSCFMHGYVCVFIYF